MLCSGRTFCIAFLHSILALHFCIAFLHCIFALHFCISHSVPHATACTAQAGHRYRSAPSHRQIYVTGNRQNCRTPHSAHVLFPHSRTSLGSCPPRMASPSPHIPCTPSSHGTGMCCTAVRILILSSLLPPDSEIFCTTPTQRLPCHPYMTGYPIYTIQAGPNAGLY